MWSRIKWVILWRLLQNFYCYSILVILPTVSLFCPDSPEMYNIFYSVQSATLSILYLKIFRHYFAEDVYNLLSVVDFVSCWVCFVAHWCHTGASCDDAFLIGSTCYKIHKEKVRWFTAVNRCLSNNATLAVFDDNVRRSIPSSLLSDNAWIGLVKSWWTWPGLNQLKFDGSNLTVIRWNIWLASISSGCFASFDSIISINDRNQNDIRYTA